MVFAFTPAFASLHNNNGTRSTYACADVGPETRVRGGKGRRVPRDYMHERTEPEDRYEAGLCIIHYSRLRLKIEGRQTGGGSAGTGMSTYTNDNKSKVQKRTAGVHAGACVMGRGDRATEI